MPWIKAGKSIDGVKESTQKGEMRDDAVQKIGRKWGIIYGIGFGAITASRIAHEAHLQFFYINTVALAPSVVGAGWTLFCVAVALAEPTIGVLLDRLRAGGIRQSTVLRTVLVPWLMFVYLIWAPLTSNPVYLLATVLGFGLLQATMNLSLLSIYPSLFPTASARSQALVPQQIMTISGLLLGMTLPALLSDDWRDPAAFSRLFVMGIGALTLLSSTLLSRFEQRHSPPCPPTSPAPAAHPPPPAPPAQRARGAVGAASMLDNKMFRLLLLNVFLCQVGNALVASTIPLFARHVVDMSVPVGPLFFGVVPQLDAKWQFSVMYLIFYSMGALSGPIWARQNASNGPLLTLRAALFRYGIGCFMLPLLPGGVLAGVLAFLVPAAAPLADSMRSPLSKFLLFAAVYAWNGFCLGGMVPLALLGQKHLLY